MIVAELYLVASLFLLLATLGVLRPRVFGRHVEVGMGALAMLLAYFIPQVILLGLICTALAFVGGAFHHGLGIVGFIVGGIAVVALLLHAVRMHAAKPTLDGVRVEDDHPPFLEALSEEERARFAPGQVSWRPTVTLRIPAMLEVDVVRDVIYREVNGVRLGLDVYRPRGPSEPRPVVLYIHGGAWFMGTRRQSRFMMYELAAAGWVVFAASYRLAPRFPLPAAIEDTKSAIAWVRAHAAEYGGRPDFLALMGGSAGGHLAAMAAFSPNNPRFQPGFEAADTRVDAVVLLYGATDLIGPFEHEPDPGRAIFFERLIFQRRFADDPEHFRALDPARYVSADVPPTLLIHGDRDGVVPIAQSRRLEARLRAAGARVHMLELATAHHAFEVFPSPLHQRAVRVALCFIESVRRMREGASTPMARPACASAAPSSSDPKENPSATYAVDDVLGDRSSFSRNSPPLS